MRCWAWYLFSRSSRVRGMRLGPVEAGGRRASCAEEASARHMHSGTIDLHRAIPTGSFRRGACSKVRHLRQTTPLEGSPGVTLPLRACTPYDGLRSDLVS